MYPPCLPLSLFPTPLPLQPDPPPPPVLSKSPQAEEGEECLKLPRNAKRRSKLRLAPKMPTYHLACRRRTRTLFRVVVNFKKRRRSLADVEIFEHFLLLSLSRGSLQLHIRVALYLLNNSLVRRAIAGGGTGGELHKSNYIRRKVALFPQQLRDQARGGMLRSLGERVRVNDGPGKKRLWN